MSEKPLVLKLKFPVTWQQEGVIQKELFRADKLLNERASVEEQRAIWEVWREDLGLFRYRALEQQILEGGAKIFPEIKDGGFELITAVLLLALGERIDEAAGDARTALIMNAYRFARNLALIGLRQQQRKNGGGKGKLTPTASIALESTIEQVLGSGIESEQRASKVQAELELLGHKVSLPTIRKKIMEKATKLIPQ